LNKKYNWTCNEPNIIGGKKMKKNLYLLLIFVTVLFLAACGSNKEQAGGSNSNEGPTGGEKETGSYHIGFSILSTQGDFLAQLTENLKTAFTEEGHKFEVASADFNPTKQIEQIENFIALGVDEIIVMAVDPSSLSDVLQKAHDQGIKIVAFSQKTNVYDKFFGANDLDTGKKVAEMAAEWIDETFPDAEPGSVEVAVFENRDKPTAAERSDGLALVTELTNKAKIVATIGVDTTNEGGQSAAENLFLTNPNVKVVISYNADTAMGVEAYALSMNSQVKDLSKFATFGVDFNPSVAEAIAKSKDDKSVVRGTVMLGGSLDQTVKDVFVGGIEALKDNVQVVDDYAVLTKITKENIDQFQQKK
jgi:ribose transport system substrate-binding protein